MYSETFRTFSSTNRFVINLLIKMLYVTKRPDVDTKRPGTKRPGYETSCTQIEKLCGFFQLCVSKRGYVLSYILFSHIKVH
jgi:hypothetical protein